MLFGQIGFNCPYDGQVQAGFDCVEDMIVHEEGKTEISVRCPQCGTLVRISSPTPIIPQGVVEQLAQELDLTMQDGKLDFTDLIGQITRDPQSLQAALLGAAANEEDSCSECADLEKMSKRELSHDEANHIEYFARELEKIESVDAFLSRVNEETR